MRQYLLSLIMTFFACEALILASLPLQVRNEDSFPFPVDVPGLIWDGLATVAGGVAGLGVELGGAAVDSLFGSPSTPSAVPTPNQDPQPEPADQRFNSDKEQPEGDTVTTIPGTDTTSPGDSGAVFNLPPDIQAPASKEKFESEPQTIPPSTEECESAIVSIYLQTGLREV